MNPRLHEGVWGLDPDVSFLNHGSYGATPIAVLAAQQLLRDQMEREPVRFFQRELEPLLDAAVTRLAGFVGADPEGVAPVANATAGVNAVLRSLRFEPGDELVTTNHAYGACANTLQWVAERWGAGVVVADIAFPTTPLHVLNAVTEAVTARTRLLLIDHVTSPTGLIFPVAEIVAAMAQRDVDVLVDGAHAPGMVPVDVEAIGAAYYTGNCHKWICAPKGAGFLWVREDRRDRVFPTVISHGATRRRQGRSRYRDMFDWVGTDDPTAFLSVPAAIDHVGGLLRGGWDEVMATNRSLVRSGRDVVAGLVSGDAAPDDMTGSLAAIRLPGVGVDRAVAVQDALLYDHNIEVPIIPWAGSGAALVRISAQLYNTADEYQRLGTALASMQ